MTTDPYEILGVPREATIAEVEARYRLLLRRYHPDLHHAEGEAAIAAAQVRTQQITWAMGVIRGTVAPGRVPPSWGPTPGGGSAPPGRGPAGGGGPAGDEPRADQWFGANPFWQPGSGPTDGAGDRTGSGDRTGPGAGAGTGAGEQHGAPGPGPGPSGDDPPWAEYDWFGNRIDKGPDGPVPCPFCGRPFEELGAYEHHLEQAHHYRQVTVRRRKTKQSRFWRYVGALRFLPVWLLVLLSFVLWFMFGFYVFLGSYAFVALVLWTQTSPRFRSWR